MHTIQGSSGFITEHSRSANAIRAARENAPFVVLEEIVLVRENQQRHGERVDDPPERRGGGRGTASDVNPRCTHDRRCASLSPVWVILAESSARILKKRIGCGGVAFLKRVEACAHV